MHTSVVTCRRTVWSAWPERTGMMPIKRTKPKKTGIPGVSRDGRNRFLVRVTWNDPKTGRRIKREGVAKSMAEAVALKESLRRGETNGRAERLRFGDFVEQWLRDHAPRLAPSTRERYAYSLAHLAPTFGDFFVDAMSTRDIRRWRVYRRGLDA